MPQIHRFNKILGQAMAYINSINEGIIYLKEYKNSE